MTYAIAALMVVAIAAMIAYPFWKYSEDAPAVDPHDSRESFDREKHVALLAIREADLDRAMGKLSDEDYGALREQYEHRAVSAIAALDRLAGAVSTTPPPARNDGKASARFCPACGRRFLSDERFCPACGHARTALA
jgi:hypothetical protein